MNRSNPAATLLFWAMILVGGASLGASLWLPAWLELRDAQAAERARLALRDQLAEHVKVLDVRREHLESDPSYIARIARREFGEDAPGREGVQVIPPPASAPSVEASGAATWETSLEGLAQNHPLVRMYVDPTTRWKVQALSALLILAAILFLARRPREDDSETAEAQETAHPAPQPAHGQ